MDIKLILANMEDAPIPTSPRADDLVALDQHFTSVDYGLETEDTIPAFTKRDSSERRDAQGRRWLAESRKWSAPGQ